MIKVHLKVKDVDAFPEDPVTFSLLCGKPIDNLTLTSNEKQVTCKLCLKALNRINNKSRGIMTVRDMVKVLSKMPQDARMYHLVDGEPRTAINVVYEAKNGQVITSDYDEPCYSNDARPKSAQTKEQNPLWKTPKASESYLDFEWDF